MIYWISPGNVMVTWRRRIKTPMLAMKTSHRIRGNRTGRGCRNHPKKRRPADFFGLSKVKIRH
jgi:hypothetical protein